MKDSLPPEIKGAASCARCSGTGEIRYHEFTSSGRRVQCVETCPACGDRRDALRYRWLRDVALRFNQQRQGVEVYEFVAPIAYGADIDSAIDAAIQQQSDQANPTPYQGANE